MREGVRRKKDFAVRSRPLRSAMASCASMRKSLGAIDAKNMFDPIEGPYASPNTRLGLATAVIWHNADHYGQMTLHLRLNDVVPPASRGQ